MGTQKTTKLREHIGSERYKSMVVVSFRRTFTDETLTRYGSDFKDYRKLPANKPIRADKLVIQLESLHRLDINDWRPDLLVLDECESVTAQEQHLRAGENLRRRKQTLAKFEYLVRYSRRVIAMDALVGSRTFNLLRDRSALLHRNEYKSGENLTYHQYTDKGRFAAELHSAVAAGKRVVFCSNSVKFLKANVQKITQAHPNKSIRVYTSESTEEERSDFANVNARWRDVDVLAYSPTLTAGVSFEEKHFDVLFAYFTDNSCSYNQCIQMMGRVRDLSSNQRHVYLKTRPSNLPESPAAYL